MKKLFFGFLFYWPVLLAATQEQFLLKQLQNSIIQDFSLSTTTKVVEEKKVPTQGETKVEAMLAKNRENLKARQSELLAKNKELLANRSKEQTQNKSDDLYSRANDWQNEQLKKVENWNQEQLNLLKRWESDKMALLKRLPGYKKNTYDVEKSIQADAPVIKTLPKISTVTKEIPIVLFEDNFMIHQAFPFPVKDQGQRPTCASFAGVRAIEIALSQKGIDTRLSEQYFYYLSLPQCQQSRCQKQGSWVMRAYQLSQASAKPIIPRAEDCPYSVSPLEGNTTQIPLPASCGKGVAKVESFYQVSSFSEIVDALRRNMPVVSAFKLSENFYQNNGHVFVSDKAGDKSNLDSNAAGHAILLVGLMKLPEKLRAVEGEYCLVVANSWGEGWGKGGHSCLSQAWIEKYRYPTAFVAVNSASYL